MKGWFFAGVAVLAGVFVSNPARAQLAIEKLWIDFSPDVPNRADVLVRNESKDRYYITITPDEILAPGSDKEQRVVESDPEKLGLLVTPNRLVIDPGGSRSIRLVSLNGALTTDRIYRVKVTPQVGDISAKSVGEGNHGIQIKVLAAYDLLVTVRPKGAKADVVATRAGNEIVLRNQGGTNVLFVEGTTCGVKDEGVESQCEKVGAKRLYSGNEWKIPLKNPGDRVKLQEKTSAYLEPKTVTY